MPLKYELLELKDGKALIQVPLDDETTADLALLLRKKHSIADTIKVLEQQKEAVQIALTAYFEQWRAGTEAFLDGTQAQKVEFFCPEVLDDPDKPDTVLRWVQGKGADSISAERLLELGVPLSTIQEATVPGKTHNPYVQDYPQKAGKFGSGGE